MAKKKIRTCELSTPFENSDKFSWTEYPRPQLKRDSWLSLCGVWQLSVKKDSMVSLIGDITVPYPPESRISGTSRPRKLLGFVYCGYSRIPEATDSFS